MRKGREEAKKEKCVRVRKRERKEDRRKEERRSGY